MIYKYTTCEAVIAKIMADLDSSEVRQRVSDIKEWIFEAVDKIGAPTQYVKRESGVDGLPIFKIEDNQIPIPNDLVVLEGVAFSRNETGPWVPMKKSTAIFTKKSNIKREFKIVDKTLPHDPDNKTIKQEIAVEYEHQPMQYKMKTSQSQFYTDNRNTRLDDNINYNIDRPQYFIKPGWIVSNEGKGYIKLAYKAIATDERGYPVIPDLTSYQEAIYWYVVMKLAFPKFMEGTLSGKGSKYSAKYSQQSYYFIQQQWNFYRNQAYAEAIMPTTDDIENIKNDWNNLIPDYNSEDTFFGSLGQEQRFYNDYYYGY